MSGYTRKSLADYLDSYDAEISALQDSKREMMQDYRAQLVEKGFVKAQIKDEIEALKRAMRRRRAVAKTSETAVEEADALADEIFIEISGPAPRATPARENIEQFPPHNPETGELTDTQKQPETAPTVLMQEPRVEADRDGGAVHEHGREEGSHPRLPSDPVENKADGPSVIAADNSPSPSSAPRMAADDEAAQANPSVVGNLSNPREPISSPAADSPASAPSPEPGSLSEAEIPQFLKAERKSIADYRPHCLNPDACGATGLTHCYTCRKAAESEAA